MPADNKNLDSPKHVALPNHPRPLFGIAIVTALFLGGIAGYCISSNHSSDTGHLVTLSPGLQPAVTSVSQGSTAPSRITRPYPSLYVSESNAFKPIPTPAGPLAIDPACLTRNYAAETANWKAYINTFHHYSFKYPSNAKFYTNTHPNGSGDYADEVYASDRTGSQESSTWITSLFVYTATNWPYQINSFKDKQKKVVNGGGTWRSDIGPVTTIKFLGQSALFFKSADPVYSHGSVELYRDDILYTIEFNTRLPALACEEISTFKFIQ